MSEILTNTGAKLWSKDDYSELWLDVFEQITGTGGRSNFRLIDEAIGKINTALDGYYLSYENDRLYICKDNEDSSITKLPVSLVDSNGNVASSVDGTTITIDENGAIHSVIDDTFSLTSTNSLQNKVITEKFDEVEGKISTNTSAIETLNGTGEGSVKKIAEDAAIAEVTKVIADAPESLDTLKEISDWISGHENDAASMNSAIKANADNITDLQTNKVDKETGKGLSTNDYTTDEKTKLSGLDDTLLNKLGESTEGNLTFNGEEIKAAQMTGATSTTDGVSGTVPAPLQGQEEYVLKGDGTWGEVNTVVDSELSTESSNAIANKAVANAISSLNTDLDSLESNFLTSSKSVYVDATNGSDETGDGTQENPWQTIQKAVDECPCVGDKYTYFIYLAQGTYDEVVVVSNKHQIYIYGATTNVLDDAVDNYKVKKIEVIGVNYLCIKGIYFYGDDNAYSKSGFAATNCSGDIVYCKFNDCMCSTRDSEMTISESDFSNCRSGSMNYGAIFAMSGKINCYNVSGSNNKCAYGATSSGGAGQIFTNVSCTLTGDIMFNEGFSGRIHYGTSGYQLIGSATGTNSVAIDNDLYTEFEVRVRIGSRPYIKLHFTNIDVKNSIPLCVGAPYTSGSFWYAHVNSSPSGFTLAYATESGTSVIETTTMTVYGRRC